MEKITIKPIDTVSLPAFHRSTHPKSAQAGRASPVLASHNGRNCKLECLVFMVRKPLVIDFLNRTASTTVCAKQEDTTIDKPHMFQKGLYQIIFLVI